jgi:hypothetical protein
MIARVLAALLALPLTIYSLLALSALFSRFDPLSTILGLVSGTAAALGWWFAARGHVAESRRRMRLAVLYGFVVGAIGFVAGFFGPIVVAPDANQGPLLGIFVTGPLGFVVGVSIGWIVGRLRREPAGSVPTASAAR